MPAIELGLRVFPAFELELKHGLFMGLKHVRLGARTTPSAMLGFQLAHGRSGGLSASTNM